MTILYDETRAFKHDFNNIIFTIGGFIYNKDIDNLKKYYDDLLIDCKKINTLSTIDLSVINNSAIYNLISIKYQNAVSRDIIMNLEIFLDFTRLKMSTYHFCRILGILLDNAIEAAEQSSYKQINIIIREFQNCNVQLISIENTYSKHENIDKTKIFKKGVSGKNNHMGLGLWEVNKILKKEINANLYTDVDENYFRQTLELN